MLRFGTLVLAVCAAWTSPLASERQVLTFRTRAWLSFAPPTCRMPLGQASGFSRADPGGRVTPRFRHRLIRFRHFIGGSLALASLNLACRDQVPTFPQRSPPSLLTTAARGGLRPAPDCRPRRALLHLSHSSAPSYADGALVTHDPKRSSLTNPVGTPDYPCCRWGRGATFLTRPALRFLEGFLMKSMNVATTITLARSSARNALLPGAYVLRSPLSPTAKFLLGVMASGELT